MPKKPDIKTVDFDVKTVDMLLDVARRVVDFPLYSSIAEADNRMLRKINQDLEEKLTKIHEEEAKAQAEEEAKAQEEAKKAADEEAAKQKEAAIKEHQHA